jgi:hypothetical protein
MAEHVPKFNGKVAENGVLYFDDREAVIAHQRLLIGKRVVVSIKPFRKNRSNEQNRYYWGIVIKMIGDYCGYRLPDDLEELHNELKRRFLPWHGDKIRITRSTATLNSVEFEKYLSQLRQWASVELGIAIPKPNEIDF